MAIFLGGNMRTIELNMFYTSAIAVLVLMLGSFVRKRVEILRRFSIPVPVVGGLLFTLITLIGYLTNSFTIEFDFVLSDFFMLIFYTSIGFTASIPVLRKAGKPAITFLILSSVAVILQNVWGILGSLFINIDPLIGVATASIPMTGGHGTSAAFAPALFDLGLNQATTITLSAATFGLVSGALLGGPVGTYLIEKKVGDRRTSDSDDLEIFDTELDESITPKRITEATYLMLLSMAIGTFISYILEFTGMSFPASVGGMIASAILVNINDESNRLKIHQTELALIGDIALQIFLAMSMMKLKLWELADLAGPMLFLLAGQVILMFIVAVFLDFKLMGSSYDAAIIASGHCGFGLGAVPTGMANMSTLTEKYGPSPRAFFIVPLIGSLFINIVNSFVITIAMNIAVAL